MGTLHWREPPNRRPGSYEMVASFGRGRNAASGYLAYSQRAGPCVLVLCDSSDAPNLGRAVARGLREEGFTALVLGLDGDVDSQRAGAAAADFLVDNWHPRLGVLCISAGAEVVGRLAQDRGLDAIVLCGVTADGDFGAAPVLAGEIHELLGESGIDDRASDFLHYYLS